jgi:hypothetical protein
MTSGHNRFPSYSTKYMPSQMDAHKSRNISVFQANLTLRGMSVIVAIITSIILINNFSSDLVQATVGHS